MDTIKEQLKKLPKDLQEKAKGYIRCSLDEKRLMPAWFDFQSTKEGYGYWDSVRKIYMK